MADQVVILHGWSDDSDSFKPLASYLKKSGFEPVPIFLGDYVSLRDDVTIDDVAKRMQEVISDRLDRPAGSPKRLGPRFHLVVHSTGGLVARRWISRYYVGRDCPVANLVMLAPANFGSKLAHKGRSMLGRVAKGWRTGFETGEEMLYALELSSPFLWDLAQDDLFRAPGPGGDHVFYAPDRVRPFVITGTHPYAKLTHKLINENGSDGTVRVSAASMNARGMTVDFTGDPARLKDPAVTQWERRGAPDLEFPLAVLPDRDHGSVVHPEADGYASRAEDSARLGALVVQALQVRNPAGYARVAEEWKGVTERTRTLAGLSDEAQANRDAFFRDAGTDGQYFNEHYQVFVRAVDDFGDPIPDYFVSFMPQWKKKKLFGLKTEMPPESVFFHTEVLADVHRHRREQANICMYIDRYDMMRAGGFYDRVPSDKQGDLAFSVTAADPGKNVAFFTSGKVGARGLIPLHERESKENRWLQRHRTHFVKLVVPRIPEAGLFKLKRA